MNPETITGKINLKAVALLEKHPEGIRWAELQRLLKSELPDVHPKTLNGCVWKLAEKFPEKVYKPEKGLFRHKKFDTDSSK